jgi:hypothetical protein
MTPAEYVREIVLPTTHEFKTNPHSQRYEPLGELSQLQWPDMKGASNYFAWQRHLRVCAEMFRRSSSRSSPAMRVG